MLGNGTNVERDLLPPHDLKPVTLAGSAGGEKSYGSGNLEVALFAGWWDKHYGLDLASSLIAEGVAIDFLGSDVVNGPALHENPSVRFIKIWQNQKPGVSAARKVYWILASYVRLLRYAWNAKQKVFHILWNNKFPFFDRTLLLLYYRLLGKRLVFTAHNVNAGRRDGTDTLLNRLTLRMQYRLMDSIFAHTAQMKRELESEFGVPAKIVTVIPYGINSTVPNTNLTSGEAKVQLGLAAEQKVVLFFGNIAPYKGLEYLVEASIIFLRSNPDYRLIIVGRPKDRQCDIYWDGIHRRIQSAAIASVTIQHIKFIPDSEAEIYFKAADVLVLPYTHIFQSGVLFMAYSYGLPVIASDVGSLRENIVEGETGFVCKPRDSTDLAASIGNYFSSDLYSQLGARRARIREYAMKRHSWTTVGQITCGVYRNLLGLS